MKKTRIVAFALILFLISILLPSLPGRLASIPLIWLLPVAQAADLTGAGRLLDQATIQMEESQFAEAVGLLEQALIIYRDNQDLRGEARALKELGILYYRLGDYSKSIDLQQQGLVFARRLGDGDLEARFLNNLGLTYQTLGDLSKAREHFKQSLLVARQQQNRQIENIALGNLAVLYLNHGDYRQAIELLEELLVVARSTGDRQSEARALVYLGLTHASLDETEKAITWYQESLPVIRQLNDRAGEADALSALARQLNNDQTEGSVLRTLGNAHNELGDSIRAIRLYNRALSVVRNSSDPTGEIHALMGLRTVHETTS